MEPKQKKLVFENGTVLTGTGFGADVQRVCEVVFNTAMVGYQEVFSDCSYNQQFVCMAYPLIGNYGLADDDYETRTPRIGGFIVREYNDSLSNFRASKTLAEEMEENGIPGIAGIDTRRVTRMIRNEGSMRALLCNADTTTQQALEIIKQTPVQRGQVAAVSCKKRWYARAAGVRFNVIAVDCGIKLGIIRSLVARNCNVTVVPHTTTAEEIRALAPDGLLFSNGPGNPQDVPEVVELARQMQGTVPMFGICLGHQVIALANGCQTYKLKFGHRGGNHPVKNLHTGKVEITSQNHSYAVEENSVQGTGLTITHKNLLDGTIEGLENRSKHVFSVQFHPEANPGPQDSTYLFDTFIANMEAFRKGGF
ncbi:glutamine-hydrolyzing carbamoyl-phosphate synthase small subunit [Ruminococcaceae bacterium OttesenSCG-928-A16]|nr:glutamine-hydrolyzing carbamoyl-phosphate synthase small subunit [Ruminococcaceae bacterium OttesenSCG-928-A16]